jgi:hypothetical protein
MGQQAQGGRQRRTGAMTVGGQRDVADAANPSAARAGKPTLQQCTRQNCPAGRNKPTDTRRRHLLHSLQHPLQPQATARGFSGMGLRAEAQRREGESGQRRQPRQAVRKAGRAPQEKARPSQGCGGGPKQSPASAYAHTRSGKRLRKRKRQGGTAKKRGRRGSHGSPKFLGDTATS